MVQLFDSWAHHLSPQQFAEFSLPYAERVIQKVRAKHPKVPLIFHANGSAGKEHKMVASTADVIGAGPAAARCPPPRLPASHSPAPALLRRPGLEHADGGGAQDVRRGADAPGER